MGLLHQAPGTPPSSASCVTSTPLEVSYSVPTLNEVFHCRISKCGGLQNQIRQVPYRDSICSPSAPCQLYLQLDSAIICNASLILWHYSRPQIESLTLYAPRKRCYSIASFAHYLQTRPHLPSDVGKLTSAPGSSDDSVLPALWRGPSSRQQGRPHAISASKPEAQFGLVASPPIKHTVRRKRIPPDLL